MIIAAFHNIYISWYYFLCKTTFFNYKNSNMYVFLQGYCLEL